jgi:hypothetical protein
MTDRDREDHGAIAGEGAADCDVPQLQAPAPRLVRLAQAAPPEPPADLEANLLAVYRSSLRPRRRLGTLPATAGLLAIGATALALLWVRGNVDRAALPAETPTAGTRVGDDPAPLDGETQTAGRASAVAAPPRSRTGLRPIGFLEAHRPLEGGRIARVELTADLAAYFGWPVSPDVPRARVQADVLYGEDGSARAIRFLPATFRSAPIEEEEQP